MTLEMTNNANSRGVSEIGMGTIADPGVSTIPRASGGGTIDDMMPELDGSYEQGTNNFYE